MDNYFMNMAHNLATKSHCLRRKVAAILVSSDGQQIITAINDPLPYSTKCIEEGCIREMKHIKSGTAPEACRCVHCETSLICQCARLGVSTLNATVYTTLQPCISCAKVLIDAGVARIIYSECYPDKEALRLLKEMNIQVDQLRLS